MNKIQIKNKIEPIINSEIKEINQLTNGEYNLVYRITTADSKNYVLRILRNKDWPEEGKLQWISNTLTNNHIPTAKITFYIKEDLDFPNGFIIQEFIEGDNVQDVIGKRITYKEYYKKLGELMPAIHAIKIPKFGYIGNGTGNQNTIVTFIERDLPRFFKRIESLKVLTNNDESKLKEKILNHLKSISYLLSVLCHNDLSPNNVMLNNKNELVLIDWDNAISSNWINDFAVMTYWMRFRHNAKDHIKFRKIFLDSYNADIDTTLLEKSEKTFHLIQSINLLGYYYFEQKSKSSFERTLDYLEELKEVI